jgi:hypothetical protein
MKSRAKSSASPAKSMSIGHGSKVSLDSGDHVHWLIEHKMMTDRRERCQWQHRERVSRMWVRALCVCVFALSGTSKCEDKSWLEL